MPYGKDSSPYFADQEEQEISLLPRIRAPQKEFDINPFTPATSSTAQRWSSRIAQNRRWWPVLALSVLAGGVLLIAGRPSYSAATIPFLPSLQSQSEDTKLVCDDAWRLPGFTWYGNTTQDVQYIPYHKFESLADLNDVEALNPEHHFRTSLASPPDVLTPGPSLSKMMLTEESRKENMESLEFLRNKHFSALGSSLDRSATQAFCLQHNASFTVETHGDAHCHFADLNFTFGSYIHFGLHQSEWYFGYDWPINGITLEERLERTYKPLVDTYGQPTILLFTSSLWDIAYLQKGDRMHSEELAAINETTIFRVSWDQLKWHRARLLQAVNLLQASFPDSLLMYRTAPDILPRTNEDEESISVFEMNQSARALMKQLRVPLFTWSDLVRGVNEHMDMIHYKTDSHANWLYGEMVLSMMKQVVEKTQDPQCWVDR